MPFGGKVRLQNTFAQKQLRYIVQISDITHRGVKPLLQIVLRDICMWQQYLLHKVKIYVLVYRKAHIKELSLEIHLPSLHVLS